MRKYFAIEQLPDYSVQKELEKLGIVFHGKVTMSSLGGGSNKTTITPNYENNFYFSIPMDKDTQFNYGGISGLDQIFYKEKLLLQVSYGSIHSISESLDSLVKQAKETNFKLFDNSNSNTNEENKEKKENCLVM